MDIKSVGIIVAGENTGRYRNVVDEVVLLESGTLRETYLNIPKIIDIAKKNRCDAIHPGYGFLSENHRFATACAENGILFIGPAPEVIRLMGNKAEANAFVRSLSLPVLEHHIIQPEEPGFTVGEIPFPVLVKPSAGGGGKGMRIVNTRAGLKEAVESASREAESYFGDGTVYIEKYLKEPRHIEVQVLGDHSGNVVHLFERECSVQRRYQKIIEEAPSVTLDPLLRGKITQTALQIARAVHYTGAGTIEFLLDAGRNFYFLEMNTRIQVEHPVSEMITGIDIVREQILIASGEKLSFTQDEVSMHGHAIEARIYAENPDNNFMPSPGRIDLFIEPVGKGVRVDTEILRGSEIKADYDPLIAKIIASAANRNLAIKKLYNAVSKTIVHGISHNIPFLKSVLKSEAFRKNRISTTFVDSHLRDLIAGLKFSLTENIPVFLAAALVILYGIPGADNNEGSSVWQKIGFWRQIHRFSLEFEGEIRYIEWSEGSDNDQVLEINGTLIHLQDLSLEANHMSFTYNGTMLFFVYSADPNNKIWLSSGGYQYQVIRKDVLDMHKNYTEHTADAGSEKNIYSPMHGKILKILARQDDKISKDDPVLIIESMKMENKILSPVSGIIKHIHVQEGSQVQSNMLMVEIG